MIARRTLYLPHERGTRTSQKFSGGCLKVRIANKDDLTELDSLLAAIGSQNNRDQGMVLDHQKRGVHSYQNEQQGQRSSQGSNLKRTMQIVIKRNIS